MKQKNIEMIWDEYIKTKNKDLKMLIIEHYVHLVKIVAGRLSIYLNQYIDTEDLISYGVIGLIDAIDKFDIEKNVKFETYASLRIRGEILDEIRKLDWIPRTLRKKQKDLDKAYIHLESQLGRPPTDAEVVKYLNISQDEYYALMNDINIAALVSIDEYPNQIETIKDINATSPLPKIVAPAIISIPLKYLPKDLITISC
jgi:RNA polymerase sigma factor for flagellar operon FliA